jgi:hypothetical protein
LWLDASQGVKSKSTLLAIVAAAIICTRLAAATGGANAVPDRPADAEHYEKALDDLTARLERNPRDASAWFAKARVIALINGHTPPDDYCDADSNWIFLALAHLDKAMRLDAKGTSERIQNDHSDFARFRETPEFKLWWRASESLPTSDAGLSAFVRENPVWNREGRSTPIREVLTLRPDGKADLFTSGHHEVVGNWTIAAGRIAVSNGKQTEAYELVRAPFYLQNGTLHFDTLRLGADWTMGRILHDCPY